MNEVLTQDEIDQLLTSISNENDKPSDHTFVVPNKQRIRIYDYRRPDCTSRETLGDISTMYEQFARNLTYGLTKRKHKNIHVRVVGVDQLTYEEFIRSVPTPTLFWKIGSRSLCYPIVAELDPSLHHLLFTFPKRTGDKKIHELSRNEMKRIMPDLVFITKKFRTNWNSKLPRQNFRVVGYETNPQFLRIADPSDMGIQISFEIKIDETEGEGWLSFFLPIAMFGTNWYFSEMMKKINPRQACINTRTQQEEKNMNKTSSRIDRVKTKIVAVLGKTELSLEELKNVKENGLIVLDKLAGEPIDIYAGGTLFAEGETVVIEEKFGIRITKVL